jgi:hypothetical protein
MRKILAACGLLLSAIIAPAAAQVIGYDGSVSFTPAVQNAAYSSGNSLGGLQTVQLLRPPQYSGIFTSFQVTSRGGATTAMTIYIFDANPSASTCTDKSAFSLAAADVSKLAMQPFVLTPAVVGAGTTATTAQQIQAVSIINQDTTRSPNLYVCIVAGGAVTPASTSDLIAKISGALD